jgi:putative tryptophan/tyrosine transport system substrate-binding protein
MTFVLMVAFGILLSLRPSEAQQAADVPRVGVLIPGLLAATSRNLDGFRRGLRDLGYVEGQNIRLELRSAEARSEKLPGLAAELVRLKMDVIVTSGTPAALAAKRATTAIPIVMAVAGDPVGTGLVASLARPGGNITGLSLMAPELGGKRLQLLKEVVPGVSRVAVLWNAGNPYAVLVWTETEAAARTLGVQPQSLTVRGPDDFEGAFRAATRLGPGALITVEDGLTLSYRTPIVAFAARRRLPAMYGFREFVDAGGLMSYAADLFDLFRRAATYVDKIIKGARPADLPVEQPTRFELPAT